MSVTVTAVPIAFITAKIIAATAATTVAAASAVAIDNINSAMREAELDELLKNYNNNENDHFKITSDDIKLLSKEFETPFMSDELLVRTLEEYGIKIVKNSENCVIGEIERVKMNFVREDKSMPFKMQMKFPEDCDEMQKEITDSLYEEYGSNTQEEAYIKIKEKIEKTNMYIEEEEILEDDSIVLTININ